MKILLVKVEDSEFLEELLFYEVHDYFSIYKYAKVVNAFSN